MIRYQEIFVPGGFPRHTYNPRVDLQLEDRLSEVRENLCKLAIVTGQTKSGKTVLTRKILPREECVWIDGGTVSAEDDFWQGIIEQLDLFQGRSTSEGQDVTSEVSGDLTAGANFFVAKGEGKVGVARQEKNVTGELFSQTLSARAVALRGLKESALPLVIDDFHYIPRDAQGLLVRALKPLVFDGLPVVIIAIPHRRYDALKVEKEMTGRISPIDIPSWTIPELKFIADTGFDLLNYSVPAALTERLSDEAIGSPHLMQEFCRGLCKRVDLQPAEIQTQFMPADADIEAVFHDVADTIGRPIFEKLARGPRQRSDRMPRKLRSGETVDIYELVLHALAHLRPGLVSLEYEELRSAIRNVSESEIPQLHEVARVLKHMATIAATDQSSTPVLDFEEDDKKLHITDPFFAFYLRWGQLGS